MTNSSNNILMDKDKIDWRKGGWGFFGGKKPSLYKNLNEKWVRGSSGKKFG